MGRLIAMTIPTIIAVTTTSSRLNRMPRKGNRILEGGAARSSLISAPLLSAWTRSMGRPGLLQL
jgi:hypothetical protein